MQTRKTTELILILGDWLVDEHWVVGEHRTASSSRTGRSHTRALHGHNCSVRTLCGAGQVATILYKAQELQHASLIGIGAWHREDTDELRLMLDPANNVGRTPHRISRPATDGAESIRAQLFNTADSESSEPLLAGTTRVIRIYRQTGDTLELSNRHDWELPTTSASRRRLRDNALSAIERVKNAVGSIDNSVRVHIVVKDLRKGVVTPELIESLNSTFHDARWYVSSKEWDPEWLGKIPSDSLRLLLIPQLAAWSAVTTEHVQISSWITDKGVAAHGALLQMEKLAQRFPKALIVSLPDGLRILARINAKDGPLGVLQSDDENLKTGTFTPMASVFFPAVVTQLIVANEEHGDSHTDLLKSSLSFTRNWMLLESNRLQQWDWTPSIEQDLGSQPSNGEFGDWQEFEWKSATEQWKSALSIERLGIAKEAATSKNGREQAQFQLWRGQTDLKDYVICVDGKRSKIQKLLELGRTFDPLSSRRRPTSVMIIDAPGSGKSYLVNCLANQLQMRFLSFNITQMHTRDDLLHDFDTIVTTQTQHRGQKILVFIDEINAKLDGQHVYDSFLAPLEDGFYLRSGNRFHIGPCLWVFAGTERPMVSVGSSERDRSDKASDFESRLTVPPFDLNPSPSGAPAGYLQQRSLENIYIGVAQLRSSFPDVRMVSRAVLTAFSLIPPHTAPRVIRQFVQRFHFIQYGRVSAANMPTEWLSDFDLDAQSKQTFADACERESAVDDADAYVEIELG